MFDPTSLPARETLEAQFDSQTNLVGSAAQKTHIFRTLELLVLLSKAGEWNQVESILEALWKLQVTDENKSHVGWIPLALSEEPPTWIDQNAPLFIGPYLLYVWEHYGEHLSPDARQLFSRRIELLIQAGENRWDTELFELARDHVAYTNVFLMWVRLLLEAGHVLDNQRRTAKGLGQWRRWFNHVSYFGLDEFASPTYNKIDYQTLERIEILISNEETRCEVQAVKTHLGTLQLGLFHPKLGLQVSGSARDYRHWHKPQAQRPACLKDNSFKQSDEGRKAIEEFNNRQFPFSAQGRAGKTPFRFTSWQEETAALGSMTGGTQMWQQVHCMGTVGKNENERATFFLPGRYTPTAGFVAQHQRRALCLFGRYPHAYHRTQSFLSPEWVEKSLGDFGIGLSECWAVESKEGRLRLSVYGWDVYIWPWIIETEKVVPVALERFERTNFGQKMFHQTPAKFNEWAFPSEARWFGCEVVMTPSGETVEVPTWNWSRDSGTHQLQMQSSSGLEVKLWDNPEAEPVEIYPQDPRTLSLFESPAHTLWPGELTARALRSRFAT